MLSEILERKPDLDPSRADALAVVWGKLVDRLVERMGARSQERFGVVLHDDHRAEAIEIAATLFGYFSYAVVEHRAKARPLESYDPEQEAADCQKDDEVARIEASANWAVDSVWAPAMAKWRRHRPLVLRPHVESRKLLKPVKRHHRSEMHYVPQSATRPWADPRSGKFNVYRLGLDGSLIATPTPPRLWAVEPFLYTQATEHHLGLVEGDAASPRRKLIDILPLSEMDRRHWIAFLVIQLMRTPRFMAGLRKGTRNWIEATGFPYSDDPASLGRAAETVFTNNAVFAHWYERLTRRNWAVVRAPHGLSFLKGDNPVVLNGSDARGDWRLHYPLSPTKCFVVGPELSDDKTDPRLLSRRELLDAETLALNRSTCAFADRSVIGLQAPDRVDAAPLIKLSLPETARGEPEQRPYWGLHGNTPLGRSGRRK